MFHDLKKNEWAVTVQTKERQYPLRIPGFQSQQEARAAAASVEIWWKLKNSPAEQKHAEDFVLHHPQWDPALLHQLLAVDTWLEFKRQLDHTFKRNRILKYVEGEGQRQCEETLREMEQQERERIDTLFPAALRTPPAVPREQQASAVGPGAFVY